jgi:hypothetical protein
VVLNYEELDINQCPGDRELNAFSSTALCDSTTHCLPTAMYGLQSGGYECQCLSGYHYPSRFQGPYFGKQIDYNPNIYPLCIKSEGLIQYPNWISKNAIDFIVPPHAWGTMPAEGPNTDEYLRAKRAVNSIDISDDTIPNPQEVKLPVELTDGLNMDEFKKKDKKRRAKRFIDKRTNFEKLKDSIYDNQDELHRRCQMNPFRDIIYMNEDDERFQLNLRHHANEVFKPQMAQALRIAHLLSAYIQLHSPFGASSIYNHNPQGTLNNFNTNLRTDPQLEEYLLMGEAMSTLIANYPIQEVCLHYMYRVNFKYFHFLIVNKIMKQVTNRVMLHIILKRN